MHMSEIIELSRATPAPVEAAAQGTAAAEGGGGAGEEDPSLDDDKKKGGRDPRRGSGAGVGGSGAPEVVNGDEVSFNVVLSKQDGRLNAVRVLKLPKGSVSFESVMPGTMQGTGGRRPKTSDPTHVSSGSNTLCTPLS